MLLNLFYFPENAMNFIILSFSVQIIYKFFVNHTLKFKFQPGHLKVDLDFSAVINMLPRLVSLKSSLSFWFLGSVTKNRKSLTQQFSLYPLWTSLTLVHSVKLKWEKSQTFLKPPLELCVYLDSKLPYTVDFNSLWR